MVRLIAMKNATGRHPCETRGAVITASSRGKLSNIQEASGVLWVAARA
jgi:hypothetical protein